MTPEPIAYAAVAIDASESIYVAALREQAEAACREYGWQLVPLYARPTLTDAEREALVRAWHGLLKLAHHEPSLIDEHLAGAR